MPRIYVCCLASYNSGILHGAWIDVESGMDADDIREQIAAMLRSSPCPNVRVTCPECDGSGKGGAASHPTRCTTCKGTGKVPSAEEWAIHDHEGWEGLPVGEHTDLDKLCEWAEMLEEHGKAWSVYVSWQGPDDATEEDFQDRYAGEWESLEDYVRDYWEGSGELPKAPQDQYWHPANYIDFEGMARDLELAGDVYCHEVSHGNVYVFTNL